MIGKEAVLIISGKSFDVILDDFTINADIQEKPKLGPIAAAEAGIKQVEYPFVEYYDTGRRSGTFSGYIVGEKEG